MADSAGMKLFKILSMENNTLSARQAEFLDRAKSGENIYLTGKAGTGKSYIVKELISHLKKERKKVVALAPTGIAANNIQGQTIHSMFGLTPFGVLTFDTCNFLKMEKRRMLSAVDTIIVDEVSMLRPDVLDAINYTLLKNGCNGLATKQVIFVGDLKQLPPVLDDNMRSKLYEIYPGEEFYCAQIWPKLNVHTIELDEILRQNDPDFIASLNVIREGGKSEYFRQFVSKDTRGVILAPHNSTVAKYNLSGLAAIEEPEIVFTARVEGNLKADDFNLESKITVKKGAKIMYLANSKNNELVNGTLGIFKTDSKGNYFINVNGVDFALEAITCTKMEYVLNEEKDALELREIGSITQMPIRLAYALSIHKSQGLTFQEVTIDLSLPCFQKGQLYTALSRVTSPDGLTIITK